MLATGNFPLVFSTEIIPKLFILCAALQISEFYRQRFYLDRRHEWGLHWRVVLLHFAKWPYFLLALYDVVLGRKLAYVIIKACAA